MSQSTGPSDSESNLQSTQWLAYALELAKKAAQEDEVPVGAVVVSRDGKVLGEGYNRREQFENPVAHAEMLAIQAAANALQSWRLVDCTLYVTLEPCPMCLAACQQARVSQVVYGAKDPKGGALCLGYNLHEDSRLNHRFQANYVESPECSSILTEFFRKKRSK
jgi:tRNA(adenine34) deaminase